MEPQKTPNIQRHPENWQRKKKKIEGITLLGFQLYYKTTVYQNNMTLAQKKI